MYAAVAKIFYVCKMRKIR